MSAPGATPGPWRVCDEGFVMHAPSGKWSHPRTVPIASGFREDAFCGSDGTPESRANALLIAAAPDLYAALELLLLSCRPEGECVAEPGSPADLAERALAKATPTQCARMPVDGNGDGL